jgi:capsular polysaccharide biosynthesis protein
MDMTIKDYVRLLRRNIGFIAIVVCLSCLVTIYVSYFVIHPTYEATSSILVNRTNQMPNRESVDFDSVRTNTSLVSTYKAIIKNPAILNSVINQNVDLKLTTRDFNQTLKVATETDNQVITLSYRDHSYTNAAKIVNAITASFSTEISRIMKVDNIVIINDAIPQDLPVPVGPNRLNLLLMAFCLSFLLSVAVVLIRESYNGTIRDELDINEYMGLPVLGSVRRLKSGESRQIRLGSKVHKQRGEAVYVSVQ